MINSETSYVSFDSETKTFSGPTIEINHPYSPICKLIYENLQKDPDQIIQSCYDTGVSVSRKEMLIKSIRVAQNLKKFDCNVDDVVMIISRNLPELQPIIYGTILLGAVINPLDVAFEKYEMEHMINVVNPKFIIAEESALDMIGDYIKSKNLDCKIFTFESDVQELFKETENETEFKLNEYPNLEEKVIFILCSSGTTGLSKGIRLSHAQLNFMREPYTPYNYAKELLLSSSPFWISAIITYLLPLYGTYKLIITKNILNLDIFFDILKKYKISMMILRPSFISDILESPEIEKADFSNLIFFGCIGSLLDYDLKVKINSYLPNCKTINDYGFTEICSSVTKSSPIDKPNSVGVLIPNMKVRIYKESGELCEPNEIGEFHIKPIHKFLGYVNNEKANKEVIDENGWIISGDLGYIDNDGYVFIISRKKEMVTYRGKRIYLTEIENILKQHNEIKSAIVVGIPDKKAEHLLAACIIKSKNSNLTESDVLNYINDQVADHKKIRAGVYFFEKFPETLSGKIRRIRIIEMVNKLYNEKN